MPHPQAISARTGRPSTTAARLRQAVASFAVLATAALSLWAGTTSAQAQALLGVYYGNQGWEMDEVRTMEAWQGKRHAVVNLFTDWCDRSKTMDNLFKQQLPKVWASGNVPVISWELYLCPRSATPADVEARAARGDYDTYVAAWADRLKGFVSGSDGSLGTDDDRRVYIRLAHEMNGDWYPWSAAVGGDSPAHYVGLWQRVRGIFWAKGMDARTVQWIWAVNHEDVGGVPAEAFFPGIEYVDWIGIDGYNWGTSQPWSNWRTPQEVFGPMVARLRAISWRPLALTETASSSTRAGGVDVAGKSAWITAFFGYVAQAAVDARMLVWFNEDKETDWAVFGGANGDEAWRVGRRQYKAYSTYRTAVRDPRLLGSDTANPRLLSDAQFRGDR